MAGLDGEIHVYRLSLSEETSQPFRQTIDLLAPDERERADRYRYAPAKRSFVRVRVALRILLSHYLGQTAESIRFDLGATGKPRLAGTAPDQGLVFNVSHSGDVGLIAFAKDTALGVDVERIRTMAYQDAMAERCFSAGELACWKGLPEAHRETAFFSFWSCKEAFVKASGEGIALGLNACVVDLSDRPRMVSVPDRCGKAVDWRLTEIPAGDAHRAAVCHRGEPRSVQVADYVP